MANVRDSDTALWLHNKLGSAEELWLPSSISGIIKTTTIDNIYRCFTVLTTTVKLKLLLGVLHLPRRNLEEMKHTIEGIIELALEDSDRWVKLVAGIIKTYPMTFNLNLDLTSSSIAQHVLQQVREKVKAADNIASLPLECQYVNKTALQSLVGNLPPVKRHFSLLKRPKSAALRTELLHKSDEAVTQLKKGGVGMGSKTVPVKHRDMTRRSSDIGPMKRIPTKATMSRPDVTRSMSNASQQPSSQPRSLARISSRQQPGGTKLLDISEQPIGGSGISARDSKRRKKLQQQQDAANLSQQPEDEEMPQEKAPPDYAAGLIPSVAPPESVEEVISPTSVQPSSVSTTPRRSTAESTEQEEESSEEENEPEAPPKPTVFHPVQTKATPVPQIPQPVRALPTSPPVTTVNVRLVSPQTIASSSSEKPTFVYAIPTTLQSPPRPDLAQSNKTIFRIASPPGAQVKSPEQRMSVPFQQVQVIRQVSPVVRQVTPPRAQPQPSSGQRMRSPIVVQKFQSPPGPSAPNPPSSAPAPPVIFQQQRPQTTMPMFLANSSMIAGQQIQRFPQNLSNIPATIVIRQQSQQQKHVQQQQQLQQQIQQQQAQQLAQQKAQQQQQQQKVQQQAAQLRPTQPITFAPQIRLPQQPHPSFYPPQPQQQRQQVPQQQTPQPPQPPQQVVQRQPQPQQQSFMKPQMASTGPPKHGLMLSREQMFEAQELFRMAPKLTRPEKALIIGFIAGNRENPYPEQGDVIQFVLSEQVQHIQNAQSGGIFPVIVETVLELNYTTGKLAKVSRLKTAQQMLKT